MAGNHDGHRERMRDKLQEFGAESFKDHELIEMLLYYSIPRRNTNEAAHRVLDAFDGSLTKLVISDPKRISDLCGISTNSAALFTLIGEINKRVAIEKWDKKIVLDTPHVAGEYAISFLDNLSDEVVHVVCLNSALSVIKNFRASKGTADSALIEVRQVVEIALQYKATNIIIMHNHPSGNKRPSYSDIKFTSDCFKALSAINIGFNDHIIVAGGDYYSFSEDKIMPVRKGDNQDE